MRLTLIASLALGLALAGCGSDSPGTTDGGKKDAGTDSGKRDMTQPPADGPEDHDGPGAGDGPRGDGALPSDAARADMEPMSDAALADMEPMSDAARADMKPPSDAARADMPPLSDAAAADMTPDAPLSDAALADMTTDAPMGDAALADMTTDAPLSDAALADMTVDAPPPDQALLSDAAAADMILSDAALADLTPGNTQCTDLIDNDGDGLIDHLDPECTGALDNDEGSFGTGIPGDNKDCKQDCFFDGNSGGGGGDCVWQIGCDPLDTTNCKNFFSQPGGQPCDDSTNPCAATEYCENGYCLSTKDCVQAQDPLCLDFCVARTPNGCDCFGCCTFPHPTISGSTISVRLVDTCKTEFLTDPTKCPPCTPSSACENDCGNCELCRGKTELPPECYPDSGVPVGDCPTGWQWCGDGTPCPVGTWCLDGCCAPAD